MKKEIEVYGDWSGLEGPRQIGTLIATAFKGKETYTFEYAQEWLKSGHSQQLDPDLALFKGPQYPRSDKNGFGLFLDSSPDRWGRILMKRREKALAKEENRPERTLLDSDFLLGVYDAQRMGAIRFKLKDGVDFLNNDPTYAVPPWAALRELEHASARLEEDDALVAPEYMQWLRLLIAPGSSLGGARPKAGILDPAKRLWIAKFPSRYDEKNIAAWEMLAHRIAKNAGINVAEANILRLGSRHHTFLTKRFDREMNGQRIHFASAMTLLGRSDGDSHENGVSYLELAEFLMRYGANTAQDLAELWRRIVFNIAISNTDDHLRNHGFLLAESGWQLSPAYDMNPVAFNGSGLKLNITDTDNALDYELALETAVFYRLDHAQALEIIEQVRSAASKWRAHAAELGIPRSEVEMMENAFNV